MLSATPQPAPDESDLLHIHGRHVTGDLAGRLTSKAYRIRSAAVYEAVAAETLTAGTRNRIADGTIDAILFFSPRTMRTFVTLVQEAALADRCERIVAICLSSAVAEAGSALAWHSVEIAETPDRAAILALCDSVQESRQT
jgi:uroporphyrinogen-III synthase